MFAFLDDEMLPYLRGVDQYLDRTRFPVPAVIVLDLHLPDSDGLEAQAMLRSSLKISAHSAGHDQRRDQC